ncbi:shikimate kinase [Sandaracinobacter sp. RS1-74]|nr:shikimate kinase [Sandaracinobacteroides sayramensis]MCG2840349.1 shikimate kinase [Sandaracinobacteroides sayramensis]
MSPALPPLRPDWRKRPLVLVGLMGSGKTTVGRRLAARLNWPFVDADAEIEAAAQMPISEIFARFGEPHFRDGERRVIGRLMESGQRVIATGGGAFVDAETRALILREGTAIWLDAAIETLVSRVARRSHRPLLVGRNPAEVLTELMAVRGPLYAEAPIRVVSANAPHDDTVNAILDHLKKRDPKFR